MYFYHTFVLLLVALKASANEPEVDLDQLKSQLPEGILPSDFANTSAVVVDDFKKVLKEKCEKETKNEDSFKEIEDGVPELMECVQNIINVTAIQIEMDVAKPIGELDSVFHKYCLKRPEVLNCVSNFNKKVKQCLDNDEKESNDTFMRILTSILNFVCHKGGDQIALFIAEEGPECLEENKDAITNCLNKTVVPYLPKDPGMPTLDNIPKLVIGPKQCDEMNELKTCVVDSLQKCKDVTPANIIESMFKFIRNETNCEEPKTSDQASIYFHFNSIFVAGLISFSLVNLLRW